MLNATQTLRLTNEFLFDGGYSPNIDAETLEKEIDLVSAASEMLAALEAVDALIGGWDCSEALLVEDAIAKAKGH